MLINMFLMVLFWLIPMLICMDDIDNSSANRQMEALIISVIPFINIIVASVILYNRFTGRR